MSFSTCSYINFLKTTSIDKGIGIKPQYKLGLGRYFIHFTNLWMNIEHCFTIHTSSPNYYVLTLLLSPQFICSWSQLSIYYVIVLIEILLHDNVLHINFVVLILISLYFCIHILLWKDSFHIQHNLPHIHSLSFFVVKKFISHST